MAALQEIQKNPENVNKQTLKKYKELISGENFQNYMHILLDALKQDASNRLGNPRAVKAIDNEISAIKSDIKSNGFLGKNLNENKKTLLSISQMIELIYEYEPELKVNADDRKMKTNLYGTLKYHVDKNQIKKIEPNTEGSPIVYALNEWFDESGKISTKYSQVEVTVE